MCIPLCVPSLDVFAWYSIFGGCWRCSFAYFLWMHPQWHVCVSLSGISIDLGSQGEREWMTGFSRTFLREWKWRGFRFEKSILLFGDTYILRKLVITVYLKGRLCWEMEIWRKKDFLGKLVAHKLVPQHHNFWRCKDLRFCLSTVCISYTTLYSFSHSCKLLN